VPEWYRFAVLLGDCWLTWSQPPSDFVSRNPLSALGDLRVDPKSCLRACVSEATLSCLHVDPFLDEKGRGGVLEVVEGEFSEVGGVSSGEPAVASPVGVVERLADRLRQTSWGRCSSRPATRAQPTRRVSAGRVRRT
jgi:hypothetical protein